jgi:hypothetical protein
VAQNKELTGINRINGKIRKWRLESAGHDQGSALGEHQLAMGTVARNVVLATEKMVERTRMAAIDEAECCRVFIEPVVDCKIRHRNSGSENIFHCSHSRSGLPRMPSGG